MRNITRRKERLFSVEPHEWATYFQELFSINSDRMLADIYEMQMLSHLCIYTYKKLN
jgi:hypothetical protein